MAGLLLGKGRAVRKAYLDRDNFCFRQIDLDISATFLNFNLEFQTVESRNYFSIFSCPEILWPFSQFSCLLFYTCCMEYFYFYINWPLESPHYCCHLLTSCKYNIWLHLFTNYYVLTTLYLYYLYNLGTYKLLKLFYIC